MRYPASEKLEIIRLVEQSHLPIKQTLDNLGIPRTTFYRWYDRYQVGGPEVLEDRSPMPPRVWNRIPDDVRRRIVDLALDVPELSPRELAVRFTDTEKYFVSEASVYRLLKSLDLITSPAFIVIKVASTPMSGAATGAMTATPNIINDTMTWRLDVATSGAIALRSVSSVMVTNSAI
jgi:transposase-like protein